MSRIVFMAAAFMGLAACATASPRADLEDQLLALGFSTDRAECFADELDERLEREDLRDVADFVASLNEAASPGEGLDALLSIDNPRAATAIARAGISCAF